MRVILLLSPGANARDDRSGAVNPRGDEHDHRSTQGPGPASAWAARARRRGDARRRSSPTRAGGVRARRRQRRSRCRPGGASGPASRPRRRPPAISPSRWRWPPIRPSRPSSAPARPRPRASRDWTVKHDLDGTGLKPATDYWYRFRPERQASPASAAPAPCRRARPRTSSWRWCRAASIRTAISTPMTPSPSCRASTRCCTWATTSTSTAPRSQDYGMTSPTGQDPRARPAARDPHAWTTIAAATPSTRPTPPCRPPTPARRGSWSGTTTRPPKQLDRRGREPPAQD
jgi:hypothetical protein